MVTFLMTLTDPNPIFKVTVFSKSNISKNGASYRQIYYKTTVYNLSNGTTFNDLE